MAKLLRLWLGLCLLAGLGDAALAQKLELAPSAALECLTPKLSEGDVPEYPFAAFKRGEAGRVKVALTFTTPDTRPAVKVLEREGDGEFVHAVEDHARKLRVPCHDGGVRPVQLELEFVFKPDDRKVFWQRPVDLADVARKEQLACLKQTSSGDTPLYPAWAKARELQGRVLAQARFEAPDRPPVVQVFARPRMRLLADQVKEWTEGYRMPCHQGGPVTVQWTFVYVLDGSGGYGFKPGLSLAQILPLVKGIHEQKIDHDLNIMGCPFDLRLAYRRPGLINQVGEVGVHNPARQPLIDWLAAIELDLPSENLDRVFGDTMLMTVPCGSIHLAPTRP
jgi:hypothetical protein